MLKWQSHTVYTPGKFLIGNNSGTDYLFQLQPLSQPFIVGTVNAYVWPNVHTGPVGIFNKTYPTNINTASANATGNSLSFVPTGNAGPIKWNTLNGAGEITGTTTPFPSFASDFQMAIVANLLVPKAGEYNFTITHHDGMVWGIGNGASKVSGVLDDPVTNNSRTQTAINGYPIMGGTNRGLAGCDNSDCVNHPSEWVGQFIVNFPSAGLYPVEINFAYWFHSGLILEVQCNNEKIAPGPAESGTTEPVWPAFSTSGAPAYANVSESVGQFVWANLGPVSDFTWHSNVNYTLPDTSIIDVNGNIEASFRTGVSGSTIPTFSNVLNGLTNDNPNLIWINEGQASAPIEGTISARNGGYQYGIALVNTLDDTVSNLSPLSTSTGNFVGAQGIAFPPGSGLPSANNIDPQVDYVAIFRTTDGKTTPFLIQGNGNTPYTLTINDYLTKGFVDTTADTDLNNLIQGATAGENTPPLLGAQNLTYHLNRIFFSVGNVVYWTTGPDTPVGNGLDGVAPLNFAECPALVKRLVPTAIGVLVFTVESIFVIPGQGTTNSPILGAQPYLQDTGLLSYNALDVNGSIIGMFTTDNQFILLDPSSGVSYAGFPIGDKLRQTNGGIGAAWNPANVYVTWHINGDDQAWYLSDGSTGWYRLMPTPAPEVGYTWSTFAQITGGCKAVQNIEIVPGQHRLLLGPINSGPILKRDLTVFSDNTQAYSANAVVGSAVLVQPGQVAAVSFITTESVKVGTPLLIGVLIDEAIPYYTDPPEVINDWEYDPPSLTPSQSILGQRFYLDELEHHESACRHMQIQIIFPTEAFPSELLTLTIFGKYLQEN